MKPSILILIVFCCVTHLCGCKISRQRKTEKTVNETVKENRVAEIQVHEADSTISNTVVDKKESHITEVDKTGIKFNFQPSDHASEIFIVKTDTGYHIRSNTPLQSVDIAEDRSTKSRQESKTITGQEKAGSVKDITAKDLAIKEQEKKLVENTSTDVSGSAKIPWLGLAILAVILLAAFYSYKKFMEPII